MVTFDPDVWVPGMIGRSHRRSSCSSPAAASRELLHHHKSRPGLSAYFCDDDNDIGTVNRPITPASLAPSPPHPAEAAAAGAVGARAPDEAVHPDGFLRGPAAPNDSRPALLPRQSHLPELTAVNVPAKRPTLLTRILHGELPSLHSPLPSPNPETPEHRAESPRKEGSGDLPPRAPRVGTPPLLQAPMPQNVARKNNLRELLIRKASVYSSTSSTKKDAWGSSCSSSSRSSSPGSPGSDDGLSFSKKYGVPERGSIGQGATAVVRLVHKLEHASNSEKYYAVKEFRQRGKDESEREYIKKLAAEFCISSTLHHVNVIETVDLVQDENQHWCEVMEYCPGGDLYNAIKSGCMSKSEINCCFKQLVIGVGYLHDMGVAHRDIKPENLLLDATGHLKITDFGVSEVFQMCWEKSAHKSKPGILGSEPYIAPEIFQSVEYDAREVDVWACGIVYYCMLYQGIPWRMATAKDPNYASYLEQRARNAYEPIERLEEGCRDLLLRVLEPDPEKRMTIPEILADAWFRSIACCSAETEVALAQRDVLASTPMSSIGARHPNPLKADRAAGSPVPPQIHPNLHTPENHHHIPENVLAAHLNRARRCPPTPPQ